MHVLTSAWAQNMLTNEYISFRLPISQLSFFFLGCSLRADFLPTQATNNKEIGKIEREKKSL